jgi:nicotinamide riboside kinase
MTKINIAIAGGPCTGKSTLAARLYSALKMEGFDYDLVFEECRKRKKEFGAFSSPFERFYFWRIQEREELRSNAENGFITDKPLFHYYCQAKQFSQNPRDEMAVLELYRMCLELKNRYDLIIIAKDPYEISYKNDNSRGSIESIARERHKIIHNLVNHLWPEKIFLIEGSLEDRLGQSVDKIKSMHCAKDYLL